MYARICPDSSGAYKLDPQYIIQTPSGSVTDVSFKIIAKEPSEANTAAELRRVFEPDVAQEECIDAIGEAIVSDFSKRRNTLVIAWGHTGTGKTRTLVDLVPALFRKLKPAFQHAEQLLAEQIAERASDPRFRDGEVNPAQTRRRKSSLYVAAMEQASSAPVATKKEPIEKIPKKNRKAVSTSPTPSSFDTSLKNLGRALTMNLSPVKRGNLPPKRQEQLGIGECFWIAADSPSRRPAGLFNMTQSMQGQNLLSPSPALVLGAHARLSGSLRPQTAPVVRSLGRDFGTSPKRNVRSAGPRKASVAPVKEEEEQAEEEAPKKESKPGITYLTRNGFSGNCDAVRIGGRTKLEAEFSYVKFPANPDLPSHLTTFCIELWFCTGELGRPMSLFQIIDKKEFVMSFSIRLHRSLSGEYEEGSTLFIIRDGARKECSARIKKEIYDDKWHHLKWEIVDVTQNKYNIYLDGDKCNLNVGETEGPQKFAGMEPYILAGGALLSRAGETDELEDQYNGLIADVKIWSKYRNLLSYWPMDDGKGIELNDRGPSKQRGELANTIWAATEFPEASLSFDGNSSYVNVGTLGDFGKHAGNCYIELWFKSKATNDTMSLLGVTDNMRKHQRMGIELNTEAGFKFEKGTTLFHLRDAAGDLLSATWKEDLCDDRWHHIVWKITNAANNQMVVTVDGMRKDITYESQMSPQVFINWSQSMIIGATNEKGTRIHNYFCGYLREVKFVHSGYTTVAHLPLNEGIGSKVLFDVTGHGHNGLSKVGKAWTTTWVAVELPSALQAGDDLVDLSRPPEDQLRWEENELRVAYLQSYSAPNQMGLHEERLYDVMNHRDVNLYPVRFHAKRDPVDKWYDLRIVPSQCWVTTTADKLPSIWEKARNHAEASHKRCHDIFILKLGDARMTVFDLKGIAKHKHSTFDELLYSWTSPKANFGADEKAKACVNRSLALFESTLLQIGPNPQLYKRCLHKTSMGIKGGSNLSDLLQSACFYGDEQTRMHLLAHIHADSSLHEARSIVEFAKRMNYTAGTCASLMGSKTFKASQARWRCRILADMRDRNQARQRKIAEIQKKFPAKTARKEPMRALLISIQNYKDTRIPKLNYPNLETKELAVTLQAAGYQVTIISDEDEDEANHPTRETIINTITEFRETWEVEAQILVYITCRGGEGVMYDGLTADELKDEHRQYLQEEKQKAMEIEKKKQMDALEEEKRRKKEEEEEKKRQEEEEAAKKGGKGKKGAATKTPAKTKEKDTEKEKDEKPKEKKEKKKGKKGKKSKKGGVETNEADDSAVVEDTNEVAEEETKEEEVEVIVPCASKTTQFLLAMDTPLEVSADNAISVDEIRAKIVGTEPKIGYHAMLVLDVVGMGESLWWRAPIETEEAPYKPEKGFFHLEFSSHDQFRFSPYRHSEAPLMSYYFKKGIRGAATPRRRGDVPDEINNRVTIESLMGYMDQKLYASKLGKITKTEEGICEYVGELVPSRLLVANKAARKEEKRLMRRRRQMVAFELSYPLHVNLLQEAVRNELIEKLREASLGAVGGGGEINNIDIKRWSAHPIVKLWFSGIMQEETKERWSADWKEDVDRMFPITSGVKREHVAFHFENADAGQFALAFELDSDDAKDVQKFASAVAREGLKPLKKKGLEATTARQYVHLRVMANCFQVHRWEKIYRTGSFDDEVTIEGLQKFSEEESKVLEEKDKRVAEEMRRKHDQDMRDRMAEIEAERAEEAKAQAEEEAKENILKKIDQMAKSSEVTEDDLMTIFSRIHNDAVVLKALEFCMSYSCVSGMDWNWNHITVLAQCGVIHHLCKVVQTHVAEGPLLKLALPLLQQLASITAKVKISEDLDDCRKAIGAEKGAVPALVEILRKWKTDLEIARPAAATVASLSDTELRTILAAKGAVPALINLKQDHPSDLDLAKSILPALGSMCPRAQKEEQIKIYSTMNGDLEKWPEEETFRFERLVILSALCDHVEEARKDIQDNLVAFIELLKTERLNYKVQRAGIKMAEKLQQDAAANQTLLDNGLVKIIVSDYNLCQSPSQTPFVLSLFALLDSVRETPQAQAARVDIIVGTKDVLGRFLGDAAIQEKGKELAAAFEKK